VRRANCTGCDLTIETVIVIGVTVFVSSLLSVRLQYLLYMRGRSHDVHGVALEMLSTLFVVSPFFLSGLILLAVDPGGLDRDSVFAWEWLLLIGISLLWFIWMPYQVIIAFGEWLSLSPYGADIVTRAMSPGIRMVDIETALKDVDARGRFAEFAERNFIAELARFLEDTTVWKE